MGAYRIALVVTVVLALAGCLHDSLERCGELECPTTAVCVNERCVPGDSLSACNGLPDGSPCITSQLTGDCVGGICVAAGCGNGVTDPGEVCDGPDCSPSCDARTLCPPLGTVPTYSHVLNQLSIQNCGDITANEAGDLIVGTCSDATNQYVSEGTRTSPLVPIGGLTGFYTPRVTPEGDEIWMVRPNTDNTWTTVRSVRTANGWSAPTPIAGAPANFYLGRPTRKPNRRFFVSDLGTQVFSEMRLDDAGSSVVQHTYSPAELGLVFVYGAPNLSADGLRLTFSGTDGANQTYQRYADRMSVDKPFNTSAVLLDYSTLTVFMTDNCERVYFTALNSIIYLRQL